MSNDLPRVQKKGREKTTKNIWKNRIVNKNSWIEFRRVLAQRGKMMHIIHGDSY